MNSSKQIIIKHDSKLQARIAIYARYSSDMQNPDSANEQVDGIRYRLDKGLVDLIKFPKAEFKHVVLDQWVLKDEAETGKIADRVAYEMLLDGIRSKSFDAVFVDDLSRLTRSLGDQIELYNLLQFYGVELYSIRDGLSSAAPNAKMQFQVKGLVNDLGNEMHAQRTKRGQEARVLKGYSTGDICYGYTSKSTRTRMSGGREVPSHYEISINPEQARVIDMIFDLKIRGLGYAAIAKYLNDEKIPSTDRGRKITQKVCNWNSSLVRSILTRDKYIGIWKWGKTHTNV
jgi:DNA invertase Pin-like site-specific DNA recombinase